MRRETGEAELRASQMGSGIMRPFLRLPSTIRNEEASSQMRKIISPATRRLKETYWRGRAAAQRWSRKLRDAASALSDDLTEQVGVVCDFTRHVGLRPACDDVSEPPNPGKRSILVISYYSPPYRSVYGTQRIAKFMKFLVRMGWEVSLVTTSPSLPAERDDLAERLPDSLHIVRLPTSRPRSPMRGKGWFVPDDFIHWVRPAVRAAQGLIRERRISIVLATAPPYSNLLAGAIAASTSGISFVPDFRDPWSKIDVGWTARNRVLRSLQAGMERVVLRASRQIVIADELDHVDDFLAGVTPALRRRVVTITNGFDEEDFTAIERMHFARRDSFTVSYIGSFYDRESFCNLLQPFLIWRDRHPEDLSQVRFVYAGRGFPALSAGVALPFSLADQGYVTHHEAIRLRMDSDLQLFSQPSYFKPHVYSGKIFEMLRARVPILAISRLDGAVARLLEKTRAGTTVPPGRPEEAATELKQAFDRWKRGEASVEPDIAAVRAYSREALAAKLSSVLEAAIRSHHPDRSGSMAGSTD